MLAISQLLVLSLCVYLLNGSILGSIAPDDDVSCFRQESSWNVTSWRDTLRGTTVTTCDQSLAGNGRCDLPNDMNLDSCNYDGGDCCYSSCIANCMAKQQKSAVVVQEFSYFNPRGLSGECAFQCGASSGTVVNCPYFCLDDSYIDDGLSLSSWCGSDRGSKKTMSDCYSTKVDVANALRQCIMDSRSHGDSYTASYQCANQSQQCTLTDIVNQNGCELHPSQCTKSACCSLAESNGWIDPKELVLPSICEIVAQCESDPNCFPTMTECVRGNKACQGGCCLCDPLKWYGPNCDQPLCWPNCLNGDCVAPNKCACESGWTGPSCATAICPESCVPGQGICVAPGICECLYGWGGDQCEIPLSFPECVNGVAISPDVCECAYGWGGRICDYPLCQSYPIPSSDCGHGWCETPFECRCEPGWEVGVPLTSEGSVDLPFWWRGRNASVAIEPVNFTFGDSRFYQQSETVYFFDDYNAFKCNIPDCRILVDANCRHCQETDGVVDCLTCDHGYAFISSGSVDTTFGIFLSDYSRVSSVNNSRCERCSLIHNHCTLCDSALCLACDPLFVLQQGECVSTGIFEFSSADYHVYSNDSFVRLTIIRSSASISIGSEWIPPDIIIHVQSYDDSAVSKGIWSDYEEVSVSHTFRGGRNPDMNISIDIPIFDNGVFDVHPLAFNVRLSVNGFGVDGTSAVQGGSLEPPIPYPGVSNRYEPKIDTAECTVWIWDRALFSLNPKLSESVLNATVSKLGIASAIQVEGFDCVKGSELDVTGCEETAPISDSSLSRIVVVTEPISSSDPVVLGDAILSMPPIAGMLTSYSVPFMPGPFRISICEAIPGVRGSYFYGSAEGHANIVRVDNQISRSWESGQAPARAEWAGFLHFGALTELPTQLGIAATADSGLQFFWRNAGILLNTTVSGDQFALPDLPSDLSACNVALYCVNITAKHGEVFQVNYEDGNGIGVFMNRLVGDDLTVPALYPFRLVLTRTVNFLDKAAGIRFAIYLPSLGWVDIPKNCLYAGKDLQGSPLLGYIAVAGLPDAKRSSVKSRGANVSEVSVNAGSNFQVIVTLRDSDGNVVLDGGYGSLIDITLVLPSGNVQPSSVVWDAGNFFYVITVSVPGSTPLITATLLGSLNGEPFPDSPLPVLVKAAASEVSLTRVVDDFRSLDVNVEKCCYFISFDSGGNRRVEGGDAYLVVLSGPFGAARPDVGLTPIDLNDGSYKLCLKVLISGQYQLYVTQNGINIPQSPLQVTVTGNVAAGSSKVTGLGIFSSKPVTAGSPSNFQVTVYDAFGQVYLEAGLLPVSLTFMPGLKMGDFWTSAAVGGVITINFQVSQSGPLYISVSVGGSTVNGSPFLVEVVASEISASESLIVVGRESGGDPLVGMGCLVGLLAFDSFGNRLRNELDKSPSLRIVWVREGALDDWNNIEIDLVQLDTSNTTFVISSQYSDNLLSVNAADFVFSFYPQRAGRYLVLCDLDGQSCGSSPLSFNASNSALAVGDFLLGYQGVGNLTRVDKSIDKVYANETFFLKVDARDVWEDQVSQFKIGWSNGGVICDLYGPNQCPNKTICSSIGGMTQCDRMVGCSYSQTDLCEQASYCASEGPVPVIHSANIFQFRITESGLYKGIPLLTRTGGLHASWYKNISRSSFGTGEDFKTIFTELVSSSTVCENVLQAPINYWASEIECLDGLERDFAVRMVGRVKVTKAGTWNFIMKAPCEGGAIYVNDTTIASGYDRTDDLLSGSFSASGIGFLNIRVELICLQGGLLTEPVYFELQWTDPLGSLQNIPSESLFSVEPSLQEFAYERTVLALPETTTITWLTFSEEGSSGSPFIFTFSSSDVFGNLIKVPDSNALFDVLFEPSLNESDWILIPYFDGSYTLRSYPSKAGNYSVSVTLQSTGFSITGNFSVVPGLANGAASSIVCSPESPIAGEPVSCILTLTDTAGNPIEGGTGGEYSIFLQKSDQIVEIRDHSVSLTSSGLWTANAAYFNGTVFKTQNFFVSPAQADSCCTFQSQVSSTTISGDRWLLEFTLTAHDKYNNSLISGGSLWQVILRGPEQGKVDALVSDLGTGNYSVSAVISSTGLPAAWDIKIGLVNETLGRNGIKFELFSDPFGKLIDRTVLASPRYEGFGYAIFHGWLYPLDDRGDCSFDVNASIGTIGNVAVGDEIVWSDGYSSGTPISVPEFKLTEISAHIQAPPGWNVSTNNSADILWSCQGDSLQQISQSNLINDVIPLPYLTRTIYIN